MSIFDWKSGSFSIRLKNNNKWCESSPEKCTLYIYNNAIFRQSFSLIEFHDLNFTCKDVSLCLHESYFLSGSFDLGDWVPFRNIMFSTPFATSNAYIVCICTEIHNAMM